MSPIDPGVIFIVAGLLMIVLRKAIVRPDKPRKPGQWTIKAHMWRVVATGVFGITFGLLMLLVALLDEPLSVAGNSIRDANEHTLQLANQLRFGISAVAFLVFGLYFCFSSKEIFLRARASKHVVQPVPESHKRFVFYFGLVLSIIGIAGLILLVVMPSDFY